MNITPRTPKTPFDFGTAVTQLFKTHGGPRWAFKLILATGVLMAVVYALGAFLIGAPYLNMIANMDQIETNPEEFMGSFYALIPGYLLLTVGALAVFAAGEASLHRAVLRDEDTPGIPLRFGRDELRVFGASLSVWILAFLAFLGFVLAGLVVGGMLSVAIGAFGAIIIGIAYLAGIVFWPFVAIRLAPAAGLSVKHEKMHVMAGRHVSKHRFWNMFLAYLVVGIVGYVASTIISMAGMMALIGDGSLFLASGGELGDGSGEDIAQKLRDMFSNPVVIIGAIIGMLIYCFVTAAWMLSMAGVASYTVKWWAEEDQASPFD